MDLQDQPKSSQEDNRIVLIQKRSYRFAWAITAFIIIILLIFFVLFIGAAKSRQTQQLISQKPMPTPNSNSETAPQPRGNSAQQIFQLVSQLSSFPQLELNALSAVSDLSFLETSSNELFSIYESKGNGLIRHAEIRIKKEDASKKILIIDIDPQTGISKRAVLEKYPDVTVVVNEPSSPVRVYNRIKQPWGTISFGFNDNNVLVSIVFDSIGT